MCLVSSDDRCTVCGCRWDLQRARALLEHEELLKKYNKKCGVDQLQQEKKKDRVTSLLPKIEEGMCMCTCACTCMCTCTCISLCKTNL